MPGTWPYHPKSLTHERGPIASRQKGHGLRRALSHVPGLTRLVGIGFYLKDRRAPLRHRLLLLASLAYLFSPVDLIPELFLGPLGLTDDLAAAVGLIKFVFSGSMKPYQIRAREWLRREGDGGEK